MNIETNNNYAIVSKKIEIKQRGSTMKKNIGKSALLACTILFASQMHAQSLSGSIPGLAYASNDPGTTATGTVVTAVGNSVVNTIVTGAANVDTIGMRAESGASATINSSVVTGSRVTGAAIATAANSAVNTIVTLKGSATLNSSLVK